MGQKLLTRQEELLMLAIWKLQDSAYGIAIKEHVEHVTSNKWSIGAVYAPLSRLLRKKFIVSEKGIPTNERGGKSKVYYKLTDQGIEALQKIRSVTDASWLEIPALKLEKKNEK